MGEMTVKVVTADQIPAAARKRLGLADDSKEPVEIYRYHRSPRDIALREARDRGLDEAYERAEGKGE